MKRYLTKELKLAINNWACYNNLYISNRKVSELVNEILKIGLRFSIFNFLKRNK